MAEEWSRLRRPTPRRRTSQGSSAAESAPSVIRCAFRFGLLRVLPLGACLVGGYALSFYGWNNAWMPTAYVAFALGIVLAQGFLLPDLDAGLREFFWVSLFFLLTTPLLQFGPIRMDHYNFHVIGSLAGTQIPYVLALLVNLGDRIGSGAGVSTAVAMAVLRRQWRRQRPHTGRQRGAAAGDCRVRRRRCCHQHLGIDTTGGPAAGAGLRSSPGCWSWAIPRSIPMNGTGRSCSGQLRWWR